MIQNLDLQLFNLIRSLAGKSKLLDFLGVFLADYLGYFLIAGTIFLIWQLPDWKKKFHYFSFVALTTILSRGILTESIRFFYHRPRPFLALNFVPLIGEVDVGAFPSGHAAFYFALALVVFLINKKWGQYFIGTSILMGLARVFVGVHWPLDILGGIAAAAISFYAIKSLLDRNIS